MDTDIDYSLPLRSLAIGSHTFDFDLSKEFFEKMESADVRDGDVRASVTVAYDGDIYEIDMHCVGAVTIPCDRCLEDMQESIDATYHIAARYGEKYDDEDDVMIELPRSESHLDIARMLYDTVMLDIPIQHAHKDGGCDDVMSDILDRHRVVEGGTEQDGGADTSAEAPEDPRWAALKNFKTEE